MAIKRSKSDLIFDIVIYTIGVLLIFVIAYPLYFVVIASFSGPSAVAGGNVWLWPKAVTLEGYKRVFETEEIWLGYRNTIAFTVVGTLISLLFTLPAAYSLSRKDLVGRKGFMLFFTITMFFNGGLIPTYMVVQSFGLLDTFWVIVLPFSVSVYNLIVCRTFFMSGVPSDLLEAAQLDGCSNFRFFFTIVIPISKALIAVIALYCIVGQWNQYFTSLVYTRDPDLRPLQLVLREILLQNQTKADTAGVGTNELQRIADVMKYGVIIVSTLPVLVFYPFIQKYFNQGVMLGSLKG